MATEKEEIRIVTRNSQLAMAQTNHVQALLEKAHPELSVKVTPIMTSGDKNLKQALSEIGDKGLFTQELETMILNGDVDVAVHSLKDLPTALPAGLVVSAITKREDDRDCVVLNSKYSELKEKEEKKDLISHLPEGAKVGTSSLRRAAQLKRKYPQINCQSVRGNIQTRLRKLEDENYDCLVLAAAGLHRGGLGERIDEYLDYETSLPAVGQGALGIEGRENDDKMKKLLQSVVCETTTLRCLAERAFLRKLEGGCQAPIAAHCVVSSPSSSSLALSLTGRVLSLDGSKLVHVEESVTISSSLSFEEQQKKVEEMGKKAGAKALEQGAGELIEAAR
eukprot:CAMPEP_0201508076 /NCGR_PEP_ID=MMETSP0161_2-20130828/1540_1 /ASSEMBLY_ACC=CAM_ASM_000251 /TAXON_ID=180227 /ORGANISM="Neoparamoeba aestuarina, Strain SoJaBio B1-5/56/2" /LENGTH=335 /DNA_ID=CAMNT_0047902613 /DNA_START=33 /DNA_END=1037 /DNA_ORIENTATION=-